MKTILSLTDFSESAENSVHFAFNLAKKMNMDMVLCNAITIPLSQPIPGGMVWPMDYDSIIVQTEKKLKHTARKLTEVESALAGEFPRVSLKADVGELTDIVREAILLNRIDLVVMGLSGAGEMSRFFLGSATRDLIDSSQVPLLLVPNKVKFRPFSKIAFATDLGMADFGVIRSLGYLAWVFHAELLIVHVIENQPEPERATKINAFITQLKTDIDYENIYYKNIYSKDVEGGLEWVNEYGHIDALAMIHRPHDFLGGLLKGSHSQKMARLTGLPLFVFPQGYKGLSGKT